MRLSPSTNVAVVGGGILGLATARELLLRNIRPVTVLEAEPCLAAHQTGRNSGVVHAGIYYAPNSLKAQLCLEGMQRSYAYFDKHSIPYRKVGKVIVALHSHQLPTLHRLFTNATTNAVPGIRLLENSKDIRSIEPECAGVAAIHSPETGIVNWSVVANSFAADICALGGTIHTSHQVQSLEPAEKIHVQVRTPSQTMLLQADQVIACAGVNADRLAIKPIPKILPVRGEYLRITNSSLASRIRGNIYPVPDSGSGSPFLGVHFTPTMDGDVIVGPNAVLAMARHGYSPTHFNLADMRDMFAYPGFWRLAATYWRYGLREMYRSVSISAASRAARQLVPALADFDFERRSVDRSGIRAQAVDENGKLVDDFVFENAAGGRILHVRNAPSPGATSSLAIAKLIVDRSLNS